MTDTECVLQRVVELTRLQSLDELEKNLLRACQEMFTPRDLFLLTVDRRGEARSLRETQPSLVASDTERAREVLKIAAKALHDAHNQRQICCEEAGAATTVIAYPLIDTSPLRTGIVIITDQTLIDSEQISTTKKSVLDIFRNFCELLDNAQRDELTGLLNRKTFDDNMHRVVARKTTHVPITLEENRKPKTQHATDEHHVAIVDIDHFKQINDQFGHLVGDEVILAIANLLRESIRETDLVYRFGGEEFVIILAGADATGAFATLERLRTTLAGRELARAGSVTLSYGLVKVAPGIQTHHLLDRADSALYYAKNQGRNQGHFYEDLVTAGKIAAAEDPTGSVELF